MNSFVAILLFVICNNYTTTSTDSTSAFDELLLGIRRYVTIEHSKQLIHTRNEILTKFVDVSLNECIWKCYARPRCGAAEYRPPVKSCVLYRTLPGIQTDSSRTAGKVAIYGFPNKASRVCGSTACNARETCRYVDGNYSCVIEECTNPVEGSSSEGNMYNVGSLFKTYCDSLNTTLVCADTGQWWTSEGKRQGFTCKETLYANNDSDVRIVTNQLGITMRCDANLMIIQRRGSGSVDFYRDWDDYKYGFGDICGNLWMGLENIYSIMNGSGQQFELKTITKGVNDSSNTKAVYSYFRIENEANMYRLSVGSYQPLEKGAGDSLSSLNGSAFSTYDKDNDAMDDVNCAEEFQGAWWFAGCNQTIQSHLNGRFYVHGENEPGKGIIWNTLHGLNQSLVLARMKIIEIS